MNPQDTEKSWENLISRAATESPLPDIDVRHSVRKRLEAEIARPTRGPGTVAGVLHDLGSIACGPRGLSLLGAASLVVLLLVWETAPAIREVVLAINLQSQLLADF